MVLLIIFTNRFDACLTSNRRFYFKSTTAGREGPVGQVTRRRGTVEQICGIQLSSVFCPNGLHTSIAPQSKSETKSSLSVKLLQIKLVDSNDYRIWGE